jgi:hypothetical protein
VIGYPEWKQNKSAEVSVSRDVEAYDWPNLSLGMIESKPSGRVRVVIEGEADLVDELLGKNFGRRCEAMALRLTGGKRR